MLADQAGVYSIFCTPTKKFYVGSAYNIRKRWNGHKAALNVGKHRNQYLQRAWNKYGQGAFVFEVLEECTPANALVREQIWLDSAIEIGTPIFNSSLKTSGGGGSPSLETRRKLREAGLRRKHSLETRMKMSVAQKRPRKPQHPSWRKAISEANRGRKCLPEFGEKVSKRMTGKQLPEYWKKSISDALRTSTKAKAASQAAARIAIDARKEQALFVQFLRETGRFPT